jgi:hypothetical protein
MGSFLRRIKHKYCFSRLSKEGVEWHIFEIKNNGSGLSKVQSCCNQHRESGFRDSVINNRCLDKSAIDQKISELEDAGMNVCRHCISSISTASEE